MAIATIPYQKIVLAKGQDLDIQLRVLAPETVTLDAPAITGATTLTVKPLQDAIANADKLLFGKNTVVVVGASAAAGTTSLTVTALGGPLSAGEVGQKIRDLTSYTLVFEASKTKDQATPTITKTTVGSGGVTIATQTGDDRGKVTVSLLAADTSGAGVEATTYYWTLWKRDAATMRPIAEGDMLIAEKGFL